MTVVAIWGIESDYGKTQGKRSLLTSLSTLSCYGRRQKFFQNEFLTTLKLIQSGDLPSASVTGSWAGAMGQTQFMPSTYERLAVDGDGDGRRNLITNSADALASTANYLKRAGWREGHVWGYEVRIPKGFNASLAGRKKRRALSDWAHKGIVKIDGSPLPANKEQAAILLPAGVNGPAFIVLHNFNAIYSYNASESYALAIAHLSDRLRGGTPFITPWPTNNPGLSRIDRKKLQKLLITRGYDIGKVDGLIGSATRNAIITEQKRLGMTPQDGRASVGILTRLQKESVTTGN
ncbi:UNVERIFIED_CONTAM: hypothetical protein GTU68_036259 [Idotea baltica]|nr:hypothetical protein [Idotea baltica]